MTEHRHAAKPKRWSKGRVRALAWVTGAATFLAGFGILGAAPKPSAANATDASHQQKPPRQRIIVRKVTRRVVVVDPGVTAPVTFAPTTLGVGPHRRHVVPRRNDHGPAAASATPTTHVGFVDDTDHDASEPRHAVATRSERWAPR